MLDRHMVYRPSQPRSQDASQVISSQFILSIRPIISHTLDLDRHMLHRHMVYRPSQPRSQDVYCHTLYRQSDP